MAREIRARFANGKIEPLEALQLRDGEEITIIVEEAPPRAFKKDAFEGSAGGWKGTLDFDVYLRDLYSRRRRSSPEVTL